MGRTEKGLLGNASGAIGPLVYYKWKGIDCVRTKPRVKKRRKLSKKETENRGRFAYVQKFLSKITPFIRHGFHNYNEKQTAFNSAMSYNLNHALDIAEDGSFSINHSNLRICKGVESALTDIHMTIEDNTLTCSWDYDQTVIDKLEAWEYRSIILMIPENPLTSTNGVIIGNTLNHKEEKIYLDIHNKEDIYHLHIAFVCVDHSNKKMDSKYVGKFTIDANQNTRSNK